MGIRQNPYNQISQLTVRPTLAWWKWQFSYVDLQIQWISSFLQFCDDFSQYGFHSQSADVHSSSTLPTFLGVLWILNCKDIKMVAKNLLLPAKIPSHQGLLSALIYMFQHFVGKSFCDNINGKVYWVGNQFLCTFKSASINSGRFLFNILEYFYEVNFLV